MPRHWRCNNGHDWTGDLGALTYCPECGSSDVFEIRPRFGPATRSAVTLSNTDQTIVQQAAPQPTSDTTADSPVRVAPLMNSGEMPIQTQPPDSSETFVSAAFDEVDPGTTMVQVFVPFTPSDTLVQEPAPLIEDSTLDAPPIPLANDRTMQQPSLEDSTADLEVPVTQSATLVQPPPAGPAADGPTAVISPSASAETIAYPENAKNDPADGGSLPRGAADTPTLDHPSAKQVYPDGPSMLTAEMHGTLPSPPVAGGRGAGISEAETRPGFAARARDSRQASVEGYEILGVLGRGGMGVVYKARQVKLNRLVALKMILAGGHAGDYERQRFRTEAEAVAALQHPNIVQIYEVGERDGLPFFSLEFCDGGSLQQKLGGQPIPPKLAAEIAEQLSRAMNYAHDRGIVHRDLKPANILFAGEEPSKDKASPSKDSRASTKDAKAPTKDARSAADIAKGASQSKWPQSGASSKGASTLTSPSIRTPRVTPKITDFGLAKRLDDDSGMTGSGTILGTPSYMAPEQAEGKRKLVGPPADIHALGAILYEMLCGRPPFLGADVMDTMNQVRTMDPVPPTRIQPRTPRDLETICLKCLQKEIHKRYQTAGELADDLARFMNGEPIAARPVRIWEKAWKWTKRRPAQASLIGMIVLALLGSAIGGWGFAKYQKEQKDLADGLALKAKAEEGKANEEKVKAEQARDQADRNFRAAQDAVQSLLTRIGAERLSYVPQAEKLRKELLEQARLFYARFRVFSDDPTVARDSALASQWMGRLSADLGDPRTAIRDYRFAIGQLEPLLKLPAFRPKDKLDLAETYRLLSIVLEADGQLAEADAAFEAARGYLRELAADHANEPGYRLQLADLTANRGVQFAERKRFAEAKESLQLALDEYARLRREWPNPANRLSQAKAQDNLGVVLLLMKRAPDALAELQKAVEWSTELVREAPQNPEHVKELGQALYNLGTAHYQTGKRAEAEQAYRGAIAQLDKLASEYPSIEDYRKVLAQARGNLAKFLQDTKGHRTAEPEARLAREAYAKLVDQYPQNAEYRFRYALCLDGHASFLVETDRLNEAIVEERKALEIMRGLAAADPLNLEIVGELGNRHLNLGNLLARSMQNEAAEAEYSQAAAIFEGLADRRVPGDASWIHLPMVYVNQALLFQRLQRAKAAELAWKNVVAAQTRLAAARPSDPEHPAGAARAFHELSMLHAENRALARDDLREAIRRQRVAVSLAPTSQERAEALGLYLNSLVDLLIGDGNHAEAAKLAKEINPELPPNWSGRVHLAGLMARCITLARSDKALSAEAQSMAAKTYGELSLELLQQAVAGGYKDMAFLRDSANFEVLRNDPAFKPGYEKIVGDIKK